MPYPFTLRFAKKIMQRLLLASTSPIEKCCWRSCSCPSTVPHPRWMKPHCRAKPPKRWCCAGSSEGAGAGPRLSRTSDHRLRSGLRDRWQHHRQAPHRGERPGAAAPAAAAVTFIPARRCTTARSKQLQALCEPFHVHFRALSETEIAAYVRLEQPLNCAGSLRVKDWGSRCLTGWKAGTRTP